MSQENVNSLIEVGFGFNDNTGKRGFSRGRYITINSLYNFIQEHNRYSVFNSAYSYENEEVDKSPLYGDLYLDFDDINNFENVFGYEYYERNFEPKIFIEEVSNLIKK